MKKAIFAFIRELAVCVGLSVALVTLIVNTIH